MASRKGRQPKTPSLDYRRGTLILEDIWTTNEKMKECIRLARLVARRDDMHVLLLGETGTGKNLLARAIHNEGPRACRPFVMVNIAALAATILQNELFGSLPGAFTGAQDRPGYFQKASSGTLFIDEIGGLGADGQMAILTAVEERRVPRAGEPELRECDVRIVSATNCPIEAAVQEGSFRRDLYERLAQMPIHLPPLRKRGEDIRALASRFVELEARDAKTEAPEISKPCLERMYAYTWPGNVRELRRRIRMAMLLWTGGPLAVAHVFPDEELSRTEEISEDDDLTLDAMIRQRVARTLDGFGWNRTRAAKALGITRPTLAKKIRDYGLLPPSQGQ